MDAQILARKASFLAAAACVPGGSAANEPVSHTMRGVKAEIPRTTSNGPVEIAFDEGRPVAVALAY
jgi:hypothetical protein